MKDAEYCYQLSGRFARSKRLRRVQGRCAAFKAPLARSRFKAVARRYLLSVISYLVSRFSR
jgi:hypothetical protein